MHCRMNSGRFYPHLLLFFLSSLLICLLSCQDDSTSPEPVDNSSPTIINILPASGATDESISRDIFVTFSEPISTSSCNAGTFYMDHNVTGTISFNNENRTAEFSPSGDLDYSTTYTVTVKAGIQDMAGNSMGTDYGWQFTTEAEPKPLFTFPLINGKR